MVVLQEINKLLGIKNLLRMNQEETETMNVMLFQFHEENFMKLKQ